MLPCLPAEDPGIPRARIPQRLRQRRKGGGAPLPRLKPFADSVRSGAYFPKLSVMSTISAPMRFWASLVAAPMWGVQETLGWL